MESKKENTLKKRIESLNAHFGVLKKIWDTWDSWNNMAIILNIRKEKER